MIDTFVIVLVHGAEGRVVVVPQGVAWHTAAEVGQEETVAAQLVAHRKSAVLSKNAVAIPILQGEKKIKETPLIYAGFRDTFI